MTIEIEGMTLEEIEAKVEKFKEEEEANRRDAETKIGTAYPDPIYFTCKEEYEFAEKMEKPLAEAEKAISERRKTADDKQKEELLGLFDKVLYIESRCREKRCERHNGLNAIIWVECNLYKNR